MQTTFDIPILFQQFFGFKPVFQAEKILKEQSASLGSAYYAQDMRGRNYFMPVKLDDTNLPLPVIRITGRKNIVETALVNRQGTVKELISTDDWRISIRGLCVGDGVNWPETELSVLQSLYSENKALSIRSALTDLFLITPDNNGSDKVVITHLDILETKGFKSVVPYVMELVSDSEIELTIN